VLPPDKEKPPIVLWKFLEDPLAFLVRDELPAKGDLIESLYWIVACLSGDLLLFKKKFTLVPLLLGLPPLATFFNICFCCYG
jgi:hypothetical protein